MHDIHTGSIVRTKSIKDHRGIENGKAQLELTFTQPRGKKGKYFVFLMLGQDSGNETNKDYLKPEDVLESLGWMYTGRRPNKGEDMSTLERLNEAAKILAKYDDSPVEMHAEHDIIYFGPQDSESLNPENMEEADRVMLDTMGGVHWNEDNNCWAIFT